MSWRKAIEPMILVKEWIMLMEDEVGECKALEPWEKRTLPAESMMWRIAPGTVADGPVVALLMYERRSLVALGESLGAMV